MAQPTAVTEWESRDSSPGGPRGRGGGLFCGSSCEGCTGANPNSDTIKVTVSEVPGEGSPQDEDTKQRLEEVLVQWQGVEKAEDYQREAELSTIWKAAAEAKRRAEERIREQEAEAAAARKAEEERAARQKEEARRAEEEAERQRLQKEADLSEAAKQRREKIDVFLKEHKFTNGVNGFKKTCCKMKYPIHSAAKRGDASICEMLLLEGADAAQKDSKGKTAKDIAQMKRYDGVVAVLDGGVTAS